MVMTLRLIHECWSAPEGQNKREKKAHKIFTSQVLIDRDEK